MKQCKGCSTQFEPTSKRPTGRKFCSNECRISYANSARYVTPEKRKGYNLKHDFGITITTYNELVKHQKNLCALCGSSETGHNGRWNKSTLQLAVDHSHATGKIRGLLCRRCNQVLGKFNDDPELFDAAARYLRKH